MLKTIAIRTLLIVAAASAVGAAYNSMHPAGIRTPLTAAEPATPDRASPETSKFSHTILSVELITSPAAPAGRPRATAPPAGIAPAGSTSGSPARKITWAEASRLLASGDALLVDVRPETAFATGHIPGAISAPLQKLTADPGWLAAAHPNATKFILYCANPGCPQSHQAAQLPPANFGHREVYYMPGGYYEWRAAQTAGRP